MSNEPQNLPSSPPPPSADIGGSVANRSLADALSTSFRILKSAMVVLVILFIASGTFVVEQNEQAIVLRLGKPVGAVREAGFNWAFPTPIDEVVKIPVKQSSTVQIRSHWLHLRENEKGIPLGNVRRGGEGLDPMRDGALLTGDKGLVHMQWRVTYRVDDLRQFVSLVSDTNRERAENVITRLLEMCAIRVVGGFSTEDATRKRVAELRAEVKIGMNDVLSALNTGILVESVDIPESTPPLQTRMAFDNVIVAENNKRTIIRNAEQHARDTLNAVAGAAYPKLVALIEQRDQAALADDTATMARLDTRIDEVLEFEATGRVAQLVRNAKSSVGAGVQNILADAEEFDGLLDEFLANPKLFKARIWQEAKAEILRNPNIVKLYKPADSIFRIHIGADPRQKKKKDEDQYLREVLNEPVQFESRNPGGQLTVPW